MPGLWEFPGGKVEQGESPEIALARELKEELGVKIALADLQPFAFSSEALDEHHLLLLLYICSRWEGEPKPLHSPELRWLVPDAMDKLSMPPADKPLVAALQKISVR